MNELIEAFKNREMKANQIFKIEEISKEEGYKFVKKYHYLEGVKYLARYTVGLFIGGELVGVATFSNPQGNVALKGWFGLDNSNQDIQELTRLCLLPSLNGSNATSFLLSRAMRLLKSKHDIRAVITLADSHRHVGAIYQVCNFTYYGLTDKKNDFYRQEGHEDYKKNPRGATKGVRGVWTPRSRKHRYAFIMDRNLRCLYEEQERPKQDEAEAVAETNTKCVACQDTSIVTDKRMGIDYTCPICTGKLKEI